VVTPENKKCFLKELSHLKIYPNPANDYIVADYKIDPSSSNIDLYIIGMDGKIFNIVKLFKTQDQKIISIKTFDNGSYIVAIKADEKVVQSCKLIIIR
jgi:hypothetical protein